ncbi:flagellar biosynthetic protein FliO [Rosenbergiella sp. S61]|uniref:Flagellar biosynthetic protein FliO n=1 Tax=Rosenbergiella gaditana TaxID=2726987 RepID=A0ABS5SUG1_9GAMM|nr:flagellar biosynthetic protein FliO [Rosenbergiella gaditana]MBT0722880.1 flagellar biosynthetic protein FliO [Rosenbergiella gaditana]
MTATTAAPLVEISANQMLLHSGGALIVIILLLLGVKKLLKHLPQGGRYKGARYLAIKETLVIGPRERLIIAQVGEQHIVLGVTPQTIQFLCTLAEPAMDACAEPPIVPQRFAEKFAQFRARKIL